MIDAIPTAVPPRETGRPNWTRERFCAVALLRHLSRFRQHLFPILVERLDAPDFLFSPAPPARQLAIEVTEAGEFSFQRWLDATAVVPGVHHLPSPSGDGWVGDEPERAFSDALQRAVSAKLADGKWRNAANSPRWLVVYDNTNTGPFVSNRDAVAMLSRHAAAGRTSGLDALVLVRSLEDVWISECQ